MQTDYLTFQICGQSFGARISDIRDVYPLGAMTPVPLASHDVAGLLNLRGTIVTAIETRARLGLPSRSAGDDVMVIGVERNAESFGLLVDRAGAVIQLDESALHANPVNLRPSWTAVSRGVSRLDDGLLVALDIDRFLAETGLSERSAA